MKNNFSENDKKIMNKKVLLPKSTSMNYLYLFLGILCLTLFSCELTFSNDATVEKYRGNLVFNDVIFDAKTNKLI
jgi:hypothetical protein